ncbi:MAG: RagB/SusD family nutrient uptake outer membrane protein, partial [Pedobacter sp.]
MKKYLLFYLVLLTSSCQDDFLAIKPAKSLLVPTTLADFQALLDDATTMNTNHSVNWVATDDFVTTDAAWQGFRTPEERNSYIWTKDIFEGGTSADWNKPYLQVLNANIVLDGLKTFKGSINEQQKAREIEGSALFYRAMAFYNLLQKFAVPYNSVDAGLQKGIPIRVLSDINSSIGRGTLQESYDQVILDLEMATSRLPASTNTKTRPAKAAGLALLARVYLTISNYEKALFYAEECLKLNHTLLDYNLNSPNVDVAGNAEVIYNCGNSNWSFINSTLSGAPADLYALYQLDDLRRQYYFIVRPNNIFVYRQMNAQNVGRFSGLATDEVYLTKAECQARLKISNYGLDALNELMIKRWRKDEFMPFSADNAETALKLILTERRKELVNRGTRWTDLRRLNLDSNFAVTIKRNLKGQEYVLLPNDVLYTYPIPQNEINA